MRLVITGGGTGGHVFPALEVARSARERGWAVTYLGSVRGQEGKACAALDLPFIGLESEPMYSLFRVQGWRALWRLYTASLAARRELKRLLPACVFSTGGYSSAPVVKAARDLGIPYVIHEQNTVPGRTNRIFGRRARSIATTFRTGGEHFAGRPVVRTGLPIRRELRDFVHGNPRCDVQPDRALVLVVGGSQGAVALNEAALATAVRMAGGRTRWLCIAGARHYEGMCASVERLGIAQEFELKAYLSAAEMADAYSRATVVACRSGGSLAELAAFCKPGVLVPFPSAVGDHQTHNAREFVDIGAADLVPQPELGPVRLEATILKWIEDESARRRAEDALAEWDVPDAVDRVLRLLEA